MSIINWPIIYLNDPLKGRPLFLGQIFVGEPDLDPEIVGNQKQLNVIEPDGTVVPVDQPFIVSAGGNPVYNGNPVQLDVDGNYSIKILNNLGAQTYYIENVEATGSGGAGGLNGLTLAEALASNDISDGDALLITDRFHSLFTVVETSTVTPNSYDVVQSIAQPTLSLVLNTDKEIVLDAMVDNPLVNADGAVIAWLQHEQKNKPVIGTFLITNIDETVSDFNIYGGGTLSSTGGAATVFRITGDDNKIEDISILSIVGQDTQTGLLTFVGNRNTATYNTIKWDVFNNPTIEGEQFGSTAIAISGDKNLIQHNFIDNANQGVKDFGYNNTIKFNTMFQVCTGVELTNKSRYTKVLYNDIDGQYAGADLGGCDGVFGNRNHRYSKIIGNTIINMGEHGTYLQGDSFCVEFNTVRLCRQSGIKAGAKTTGNFWYVGETVEELAPNGDYTGFDIIIANNTVDGNEIVAGTTAEIYLQPNVMDAIIEQNTIRNGGSHGIRTVFFSGGTVDEVMQGITIRGNIVNNTVNPSILCACSDTANIDSNMCDGVIQTDARDAAEPTTNCNITNNDCSGIIISRGDLVIIEKNRAQYVTVVSNVANLINNILSAQELGNFNARVRNMEQNTVTWNGDVSVSIQGLNNVERNDFIFPDSLQLYPLDVDFNSVTPTSGGFDNNKVTALLTARPLRVGGSNSTINGNKVFGTGASDFTFGVYADDCVISGNVVTGGFIRLEAGSSNNIVGVNAAKVQDDGTTNVLGISRP